MSEQRGVSGGFDSEQEAREASREMAVKLIEELKSEGFTRFAPPARPTSDYPDSAWDEFADCRVVVAWIATGLPTRYAGFYAVRVDTLARR